MKLVIMNTFKMEGNEEVAKKFYLENNCVLIIVPHKLTNKSNQWTLPSISQQKVSSKRGITYDILNRSPNNLTKTKIK